MLTILGLLKVYLIVKKRIKWLENWNREIIKLDGRWYRIGFFWWMWSWYCWIIWEKWLRTLLLQTRYTSWWIFKIHYKSFRIKFTIDSIQKCSSGKNSRNQIPYNLWDSECILRAAKFCEPKYHHSTMFFKAFLISESRLATIKNHLFERTKRHWQKNSSQICNQICLWEIIYKRWSLFNWWIFTNLIDWSADGSYQDRCINFGRFPVSDK